MHSLKAAPLRLILPGLIAMSPPSLSLHSPSAGAVCTVYM